jgi:hypothetical protein
MATIGSLLVQRYICVSKIYAKKVCSIAFSYQHSVLYTFFVYEENATLFTVCNSISLISVGQI